MKFKITKITDKTVHYEWLMEHVNKLMRHAKNEDFKSVAYECENILEGLRENRLDSRSKKDSRVKDEDITFDILLKSEYEAIALYTSMLAKIDDENAKIALKHILDEENEHIVEIKKILAGKSKEVVTDSKTKDSFKNTKAFEKVLLREGVSYKLKNSEFSFKDEDEYNKAIRLLEKGLSFKYGGYDSDDNSLTIEIAETI